MAGVFGNDDTNGTEVGAFFKVQRGFYTQSDIGISSFDAPITLGIFTVQEKKFYVFGGAYATFLRGGSPVLPLVGIIWIPSDTVVCWVSFRRRGRLIPRRKRSISQPLYKIFRTNVNERIQRLLGEALAEKHSSGTGESSITSASRAFLETHDADDFFNKLRPELFRVREWNEKATLTSFELFDEKGDISERENAVVGDFIRLSMAGTGKKRSGQSDRNYRRSG